jgi:hypothetical protein
MMAAWLSRGIEYHQAGFDSDHPVGLQFSIPDPRSPFLFKETLMRRIHLTNMSLLLAALMAGGIHLAAIAAAPAPN